MRLFLSYAFSILLFCAASAVTVMGQAEPTSILKGRVVDAVGGHVPGARVLVDGIGFRDKYEAVTDAEGTFKIAIRTGAKTAGRAFRLEVIKRPYKKFSIMEYQVPFKGEMNLDISLICENCESFDDL